MTTLNLLAVPFIPEDARTIVIAGPNRPLDDSEVALLRDFLNKGGGLVLLQEPAILTGFGGLEDPLSSYLADKWGILIGDDLVIDPSIQQPFLIFTASYDPNHLITICMQRLTAAFWTTRSVRAVETESGAFARELAFSAPQAWGVTNIETLDLTGEAFPVPLVDFIGPVPLMAASEDYLGGGRVAVFGDADFALNPNFTYPWKRGSRGQRYRLGLRTGEPC